MNRPLNTAIIGLGRIAWKLEKDPLRYHPCTHAGTILEKGKRKFMIRKAFDRSPENHREFKEWSGLSYEELPAFSAKSQPGEIDLAVICAPSEFHFSAAETCIRAGVPALLIEKPLCLTLKEARKLAALSAKHGTKIWVNFERRYHPSYQWIRSAVAEEKFGPIRSVTGRVLTGTPSPQAKIGPLLHDGIHWIDLLLFLLGKPRRTDGQLKKMPKARTEHTAWIQFDYGDFQAHLEAGGRRRYFEFYFQIDFERARIMAGNEGFRLFISEKSSLYSNFLDLKEKKYPAVWRNPWSALYEEIYSEMNSARGHGRLRKSSIITSGILDSVQGMELIQAIENSNPGPDRAKV